ncbi:MAG: Rrf2 family transcriptional regulator [Spirochaetales bacterium]|nr:Rrf2 family transcriptional regulator [Spirochaetales bacterium]MCF7937830.1 Rrf2 family transcriptional regulator [Spirochaetales bacterium]
MRITTKGRYALRAVLNLAASYDGKPISIRKIAEEEEISPEFLEQIFFNLKKAGIIDSVRGPGGGFMLKQSIDEVSVKDIFLAVGETLGITPCTFCTEDETPCPRQDNCITYQVWKEAATKIQDHFAELTIRKILDEHGPILYDKKTAANS